MRHAADSSCSARATALSFAAIDPHSLAAIAESDSSMKWLLNHPSLYMFYQTIIGAKRARRRCVEQYVRPVAGQRVLDVGCGPGYVIEYLPQVDYVGLDIDAQYIEYAQRRYGDAGEFHCVELTDQNADSFGEFDVVMLNGVVHHLDDQQTVDLLKLLRSCLTPGGRVVTLDGCYRDKMSPISRYLLRHDRGEHVRTEDQYVSLAKQAFPELDVHLHDDLFFIPYDLIIMVCPSSAPAARQAA